MIRLLILSVIGIWLSSATMEATKYVLDNGTDIKQEIISITGNESAPSSEWE